MAINTSNFQRLSLPNIPQFTSLTGDKRRLDFTWPPSIYHDKVNVRFDVYI